MEATKPRLQASVTHHSSKACGLEYLVSERTHCLALCNKGVKAEANCCFMVDSPLWSPACWLSLCYFRDKKQPRWGGGWLSLSAHKHTHARAHASTRMHTHINARIRTHTHAHTRTHSHTCPHTHTCLHAHAHTHAHTHASTHTLCVSCAFCLERVSNSGCMELGEGGGLFKMKLVKMYNRESVSVCLKVP